MRRILWVVPALILLPGSIYLLARNSDAYAVASAQGAGLPVQSANLFQTNLLGNGGFEEWSFGVIPKGPPPTDLWYPNGDTSNLFGQSSVGYDRVEGGGVISGDYSVAIWPATFNDFISQTLENASEFRGKTITFSVDLKPDPQCGSPTSEIVIDDGVTSSSVTQLVSGVVRLLVSHTVSITATKLEFRIFPRGICVIADNAQATLGLRSQAPYVPRSNPEPALPYVPLGTVIDWWRPNDNVAVPERFAICAGQLLNDPSSPFNGQAMPDLRTKFVRGVELPEEIGDTGGSETNNLAHTHGMSHTHAGSTDQGGHNIWAGNDSGGN